MASLLQLQPHTHPRPRTRRVLRLAGAWLALSMMACTALAQNLVIESWRKDDQLFWDKVLIPAFA